MPVLRTLADGGFQGPALGDLGYRGDHVAKAGETLGIAVEAIARGRDGRFVPAGDGNALDSCDPICRAWTPVIMSAEPNRTLDSCDPS